VNRATVGVILVIAGSAAFGLMGLFNSWAKKSVSTEMLLALRFGIAGLCLAALMTIRGTPWPRGRTLLALLAMGAVLYAAESTLFFHAMRHIPSGMVSLLLYLYPAIVVIAAWTSGRESPDRRRGIAVLVALAGLALTIVPIVQRELEAGGVSSDGSPFLGVALGVGTAIVYSIYILVGGDVTRRAGAIPASTIVILAAAAVLGSITLARGDALPAGRWPWLGALGLAIPSTLFAITAILAGLERIGPVRTSTLATVEPLVTVLVGAIALREELSWVQWIGGGLILIAAILTSAAPTSATVESQPTARPAE
jgi:drug/metabolite transporter (DMT)-like permease